MSTPSRQRTDAIKNRDRIVIEARKIFSEATKTATLEAIARSAGVGIGTLYRHFPTKEALVEAVYRSEIDVLDQEADNLLAKQSSAGALRQWMNSYARFVATKHAMHDALRIALTFRSSAGSETRIRINATIQKFLSAGQIDRSIRDGIGSDDLTLSLAGLVFATTASVDEKQIARMLDLLMKGLYSPD